MINVLKFQTTIILLFMGLMQLTHAQLSKSYESKLKYIAEEWLNDMPEGIAPDLVDIYRRVYDDPRSVLSMDTSDPYERWIYETLSPYITGEMVSRKFGIVYPFSNWTNPPDYELFPVLALEFRLKYLRDTFEKVENFNRGDSFSARDQYLFVYMNSSFNYLTKDMDFWELPEELVFLQVNAENIASTIFENYEGMGDVPFTYEDAIQRWGSGIQPIANRSIWKDRSVVGFVIPELLKFRKRLVENIDKPKLEKAKIFSVPEGFGNDLVAMLIDKRGPISENKKALLIRHLETEVFEYTKNLYPYEYSFRLEPDLLHSDVIGQIRAIDNYIVEIFESFEDDEIGTQLIEIINDLKNSPLSLGDY